MIDIKTTVLGGREAARTLALANNEIRAVLRDELEQIGDEIVAGAKARAPERTGRLKNKIRWYFGSVVKRGPRGMKRRVTQDTQWKDGRIRMTVRPWGRVAHLMERGVNATFQQRPRQSAKATVESPKGQPARVLTYKRTLVITPRPFFMPAVEAVGGSSGVNARLQARMDDIPRDIGRG